MAAPSSIIFPFLSLPAELRNVIYRHLLVGGPDTTAPPHAQILRTCKQVNHEATDILYAENTFNLYVDFQKVLVYKFPLFFTDTPIISYPPRGFSIHIPFSAHIPDYLNPPPFSTDIPLHRVEKLEVHIRGLFRDYDYGNFHVSEIERSVLRLCSHWPKHHALKKLTTTITWGDFGPGIYLIDPEVEAMLLEPFSMLQNIQSVSIRGALCGADAMQHGEHE
ncbi:hypothetical protein LPUS_00809 [Lasallia pustulata]|uniref:F-box domain n=1 Tax=Lasallia pustulata TaxID=136370 RepID=A0A1W5CS52_9LECA|nr:hypothetical protein LPUS_00809 [Lasallia pustulata]